jgi:hypothetical protein
MNIMKAGLQFAHRIVAVSGARAHGGGRGGGCVCGVCVWGAGGGGQHDLAAAAAAARAGVCCAAAAVCTTAGAGVPLCL